MGGRTLFYVISLMICTLFISTGLLFNVVVGQSPPVSNDMDTPTGAPPLLEKIKGASSISNIQTISWVDGIEISGVSIGENQASITLHHVGEQNDKFNTPVTVMVIKTPGSSLKSLMALMEASNKLTGKNNTNPLVDMISKLGPIPMNSAGMNMSSMGGLGALNVSESVMPLQALLQLGKDTQIGIGNIASGNWDKPRTVTTGVTTLGGLLGLEGDSAVKPRVNLAMVFVVPYSGKTSFGTVDFQ